MIRAHQDSVRMLRAVLVAAVVLPTTLFAYSAWVTHRNVEEATDQQVERTRDVLTEHALKVFETVERTIAEINAVIQDIPDSRIAANEENLYVRLKKLSDSSPQIKSLWIFDRTGRALVNSLAFPAPALDFSDRDYFKAHAEKDIGTFVGQILRPRQPYGGAPFFSVSERRASPDGNFNGVIQASVLPEYFEGFYAKVGKETGSFASLIRDDGFILARVPGLTRDVSLPSSGLLLSAIKAKPDEGSLRVTSVVDNIERKVAYRKLPEFPIYVIAGIETAAVRARWLSQITNHLIFGIPATAALIAIIALALSRTQKLYEEAKRRQSAEEALKQSQRLEALGQLTGGVAHDFNNLLMVIGGTSERLKRRHQDPQDQRFLGMIESAVNKGTSLTRQLLSFARRQNLAPKVIDLVEATGKFQQVLSQSVQGNIDIRFVALTRELYVKVDPDEFEISLLNLTLNARDALPNGGRIVITVGSSTTNPDAKPMAALSVSDNGCGISPDIRDRIFEPFFTTKKVDRGTGLGLSQVYGFVQQSQGEIKVTSEPNQGTTFQILLPISNERPEVARPVDSDAPCGPKQAVVLVVEDHPDVSVVARDYVEQCGFTVVHAASAEDAVKILNQREDIDLVFSDIVMPGMSGLELARIVREHHAETPVVLASGYSDKAQAALKENFILLSKPYTQDALNKAFAQAFKSKPARPSVRAAG